jgi:Uma2 family endonuclease
MTATEYLAFERAASTKHELWAGEVYSMAGASFEHNAIVANLNWLLVNLLLDGPCVVLSSDMKVHVQTTGGYVYPDASVVCGKPELVGDGGDVIANPRIIVEVLSDSTERFDHLDHGEKFEGYRSLPSVVDYLLVAQKRIRVEHYARQADGSWTLRALGAGDRLQLASVGGELLIEDIYRKVSLPAGE